MFFYLQALRSEEASVIAIFFQAIPLFGYSLAYVALGESLSTRQMLGGLLVMAGVTLLSCGSGRRAVRFRARTGLLMLGCAVSSAVS